ncbi:MAG: sulfide/dihydroorotate dehydrogenase-like FAD/NAD-binding protein [Endomicrobia bacterium]|nr:sulfide/dihydroorotate dehydrogenase-like FAD/NAD-binding protein [Endomicrobiia bacterium]
MIHKNSKPQILDKKVIGEFAETKILQIELFSPIIAQNYKPGQFVIIMVEERGERIPLTIADVDLKKGSITLIFQVVGYTTKLLSKLNKGEFLYHIVGPLGKPTNIELFGSVVLIGGGVGTAEIYPIAKALKEKNNKIITILGARNKNLLILEHEFKKISDEVYFTTDDGSYGRRGFVSDILQELVEKIKIDLVYAVGPIPMMRTVAEVTKPYMIKTLVSLNTIMVDGTGMCGSCRITYDGKIKYVCCDGPEFDAHKVDWDEIIKRNNTYLQQEKEILNKLS